MRRKAFPLLALIGILVVAAGLAERLELQVVGGITAGRSLMRGNLVTPEPEPLARPQREPRTLNEGAAAVIGREEPPPR